MLTETGYHCCPGAIIGDNGKNVCCTGTECDGKQFGCKPDIGDCKAAIDLNDDDYEDKIKEETGITVKKGPTTSDSDSESDDTDSGSSTSGNSASSTASESSEPSATSDTTTSGPSDQPSSTKAADSMANTGHAGTNLVMIGAIAAVAGIRSIF